MVGCRTPRTTSSKTAAKTMCSKSTSRTVSDLHPTTKPVELVARMVRNSSREGELVYDPFCGSGSTLLAAHQLGRIGYGVEIDPGYLAVTLERLSMLGLKPELDRCQ